MRDCRTAIVPSKVKDRIFQTLSRPIEGAGYSYGIHISHIGGAYARGDSPPCPYNDICLTPDIFQKFAERVLYLNKDVFLRFRDIRLAAV